MADIKSPEERSLNMSRIKNRDTKPEELVRKYLFSQGFRYRKNDKRYPGKPDIVLPKYRTVVFVHGCFWHQHPGCNAARIPKSNSVFWKKKFEGNVDRDIREQKALEADGWNVIVVWECEISNKEKRIARLSLLADEIRKGGVQE